MKHGVRTSLQVYWNRRWEFLFTISSNNISEQQSLVRTAYGVAGGHLGQDNAGGHLGQDNAGGHLGQDNAGGHLGQDNAGGH